MPSKTTGSSSQKKSPAPRTATKTGSKAKSKAPAKKAAKSGASAKSSQPEYTKPDLREKIKKEVMAGDKGGRPGQWSARKAQLVAHEYEAEGGGYRGGRRASQQHLTQWTEEKWRTEDGKPAGRNGTMKRYLPDEAWKKLSPEERAKTEDKKARGTRSGKQFVSNTKEASEARRKAENKTKPARKSSGSSSSAGEKSKAAKTSRKAAGASAKGKTTAKKASAGKTSSSKKSSAKKAASKKA